MTIECRRPFDEELLTGYLDDSLPQAQAQRVRLHLEDCPSCRQFFAELKTLRQAALATRFVEPEEEGWPELPQTRASWLSRTSGWTLLIVWLLVTGGISLWRYFQSTDDPLEIFLTLGLPGAFLLLFLSVLLDRIKDLKTDRYRGVHR
jgi:anti-sigma factor RsiW